MKFSELKLSKEIQKMLNEREFFDATEIQQKAIPHLMEGKDIVGLSQTGTGKTLAFVLPILEKLKNDPDGLNAIVLCPTRELCQQIKQEFLQSSKYIENIKTVALFGGQDIKQQIFSLKRKPNIVIGTPGRVLDHIKRHTLKLNKIHTLVLDEADEMFNMGFRKDILEIIKKIPTQRQTMLFSATMNDEVLNLSKEYMIAPEMVKVGEQNSTLSTISQTYFLVPKDSKKKALHSLLRELEAGKTLIFCNTKTMVSGVQCYLQKMGYKISVLHGDMPQAQRNRVMKEFKGGNIDILVTTDVAARGIDVLDILHVINFDLPQNLEYYIHRIGRTARAGKEGNAWTILNTEEQEKKLKDLAKKLGIKIPLQRLKLDHVLEIEKGNNFKGQKQKPRAPFREKQKGRKSFSKPNKKVYTKKNSKK